MFILSNFLQAFAQLLYTVLNIYLWIVIIAVILSWIPITTYNPTAQALIRFLHNATTPVFEYLRRKLRLHRYTAPLVFTPLIVIFAIYFLQNFIVQSLIDLARALR
ncbi:MAG: YggT family protein [Candidatus Vecturithrix sp.]|jgi:YggT family protein|nr:YggT family protein [Candidatus Vecturithrix sp.]